MTRTIVITGGASGIGAATAAQLREEGCRVFVTGLTDSEVDAAGEDASQLDVRDGAAVERYFSRFDTLHGLVNAAGMSGAGDPENMALFEQVIDVNLTGTMRASLAAKPALAKGGGSVVNIASVLAYTGSARALAYAASKGGVLNLTRAMSAAWAPDGIRVTAVAPGYIETPMTDVVRQYSEMEERVLDRAQLHRWGKPEEIAAMIVWLLSDKASFVTGSTHVVDGGYLAT